jgi:hypothetical protein
MIAWVLTTCHTKYTSFSRCNLMWFLSMGLRQGWGICSSSSRKYPGNEGCYILQTVWNELDCRVDVCRSQRCTYRTPIMYVTTLGVLFYQTKNTYTPISSVLCMTSCYNPDNHFEQPCILFLQHVLSLVLWNHAHFVSYYSRQRDRSLT